MPSPGDYIDALNEFHAADHEVTRLEHPHLVGKNVEQ